jgi:hypothetical protein
MRAIRIALDVDDLVIGHVDKLGAPYGAIGADSWNCFGVLDAKRSGGRLHRLQVKPEASETPHNCAACRGPRDLQEITPGDCHLRTPFYFVRTL